MCIFRVGTERVLNSPLNLKVYITSPTLARNGRLMSLSLPPSSSSPCNYIKNLSFLPGCHTPSPLSLLWWQDMRSNGQLPQQRTKWPSESSRKTTNRKSLVAANILEGLWFLPPCVKTFTVWVTLVSRSLGFWLLFRVLPIDNEA